MQRIEDEEMTSGAAGSSVNQAVGSGSKGGHSRFTGRNYVQGRIA